VHVAPFAILLYLENGRLETTGCVHHSFKLGAKARGTPKILKVAFGKQIMGRIQLFVWLSTSAIVT
jgi:hypothetical protein